MVWDGMVWYDMVMENLPLSTSSSRLDACNATLLPDSKSNVFVDCDSRDAFGFAVICCNYIIINLCLIIHFISACAWILL